MNQVYANLYDLVEQRIEAEHGSLLCSKEAFLATINVEPGVLNGEQMESLDNKAFLETAFLSLMKRLPDRESMDVWSYYAKKKSQDKYRSMLIDTLIVSPEAISKGGYFKNNTVTPVTIRNWNALQITDASEVEISTETTEKKQKIKDKLYQVYVKLPMPLRVLIRKILRRE